ncbi:MAG: Uma2 family endonuclease [Oscillospiraceae bacterium]|nr:Uma2 family endonuclease [Oscillospiraceae bacterium]
MLNQQAEPEKRMYTVEDWEKLPEYPKFELYDGEPVMLAQPSFEHQEIVVAIGAKLRNGIKNGPCRIAVEPSVRLNKRKNSVFIPDIAVVCDPKKITTNYVVGAPDLVVEILSPSTAARDRVLKLNAYRDAGVREYWLVNPVFKTVDVFFWEESPVAKLYNDGDKIKVSIFDDFIVDLGEVFTST